MSSTKSELSQKLRREEFPRAAAYDPEWVLENQMGPNALWLTEALSQKMTFEPGMRVLDLGCGKALSSIFLAREFDLEVWATDLWISASENWARIRAANLEKQVFPLHAEAHNLPYAEEFFDAVVSLDAYHYFGTDALYLGYLAPMLKPGAQIGICVPGLREELAGQVPEHLKPYWEWDFCSFHSPNWWRSHWGITGKVQVESADFLPEGWQFWESFLEVQYQWDGDEGARREAEMLRVDAGRSLGFSRVVARRV